MRCNSETWTDEEKTLIRLVRGEPLLPPLAACRLDALHSLALKHKVLSPLAARVLEEPAVAAATRWWAASVAVAAERDRERCRRAAARTIALLETADIPAVLLKGASLAFGRPRDWGDVDLLIPADRLAAAIEAVEGAGYAYKGYDRNGYMRSGEYRAWEKLARWSVQYEFAEPETGTLVELHTAFFETERCYPEELRPFRARIDVFFRRAVVDDTANFRCLDLADRALLLVLHAGLKRTPVKGEFILRHLLDLRALNDAGLDWDQVEERAAAYGFPHHLAAVGRLANALLGDSSYGDASQGANGPQLVPTAVLERAEARLKPAAAVAVGLYLDSFKDLRNHRKGASFAYRWLAPFAFRGTARARLESILVLPLLFPKPFRMTEIYRLPWRSPIAYLLYPVEPLRWLALFFRKIFRLLCAR